MKKLLFLLLILISVESFSQTNYIRRATREKLIALGVDSTLHIPAGTTASLRTGGWSRTGAIFYDSTGADSGLYVYGSGGVWIRLARAAEAGGSTILSAITAATATNIIDNAAYAQEWQWNSLAGQTGMYLSSNSTAAASNTSTVFKIARSGANSNASQTVYGQSTAVTNTGTTNTNIAGYFQATGGSTANYALDLLGNIRLNGTSSGQITLQPQAAAGTYNWNWPTTAGTSGYVLTSAGGSSSPMTWTNPATLVTATPTWDQVLTAGAIITNDYNIDSDVESTRSLIFGKLAHFEAIEFNADRVFIGVEETTNQIRLVAQDSLILYSSNGAVTDTTNYKPLAVTASGKSGRMTYWPGVVGGSQTLQQVLDAGSTLTSSEQINTATFNLGIQGTGNTGGNTPLTVSRVNNSTNVSDEVLQIYHSTTGTAADGFGLSVGIYNELDDGNLNIAHRLHSKWSTAASASRVSEFSIVGINATNERTLMTLGGAGLMTLGVAGTNKGSIGLAGNTSGTVTIQPAAAAGTYTLTLPTDDGAESQVLTTDGSGGLSWTTAGAGNVTKVGTPVDNQIGVWTGDGTIEGTTALTYDAGAIYRALIVANSGAGGVVFDGQGSGGTEWVILNTTSGTGPAAGGLAIYDDAGAAYRFMISSAGNTNISKNLIVGASSLTTTPAASATGAIHLINATVPSGSVTDGVLLYSEDVSTSAELKVRDEAGNITPLSPHNFTGIPMGRSEPLSWSFYSERDGKYISVDMAYAMRTIEKQSKEIEDLKEMVAKLLGENYEKKDPAKLVYTGDVNNKPNPDNK